MAGIYVHIPFCKQVCYYCDFHFTASLRRKGEMVGALLREMELRGGYLPDRTADTLYFGGGTPSLLAVDELRRLREKAGEVWDLDGLAEFTVEANPEDLTPAYLDGLRSVGVDRLSIGIQSFIDRDLRLMNRRHTAATAVRCVREAQEAGFSNISVDLIYGIPGMSAAEWRENLETAFGLGTAHLSAYHLTIEEKTVFGVRQRQGKFRPAGEEAGAEEYALLEERAAQAGFEHYEISNFARPGFRAVHNSNYWSGKEYVGIGPSAHSFDGRSRRWNIASNTRYLEAFGAGDGAGAWEEETLSLSDRYNEFLLTTLRTKEGIAAGEIDRRFGTLFGDYFRREARRYRENGLLAERDGRIFIETKNFILSDGIIAGLFYT